MGRESLLDIPLRCNEMDSLSLVVTSAFKSCEFFRQLSAASRIVFDGRFPVWKASLLCGFLNVNVEMPWFTEGARTNNLTIDGSRAGFQMPSVRATSGFNSIAVFAIKPIQPFTERS